MISKELLSEVLGCDCSKVEVNDNIVNYVFEYDVTWSENIQYEAAAINLYELADKTMDWIESQGYLILIEDKDIYRLCKYGTEFYSIDTHNRVIVPFKCAEWIFKNKDKE